MAFESSFERRISLSIDMATNNMRKLIAACCGGAMLVWIAVRWVSFDPSHSSAENTPTQHHASVMEAQRAPTAASGSEAAPRQPQTQRLTPLSATEVNRLYQWTRERGSPGDGRLNPDGRVSGGNSFTGYESADNASLQVISARGDARASALLGGRLASQYIDTRNPDDLEQATRLLLDASMRGFTTSLGKLLELQVAIAEGTGIQSRVDQPRIDRTSLIQAYEYLHLIERRGDLSTEAYQIQVRNVGELNAQEAAQARRGAEKLYASLAQQRQDQGLPPFQDGIPSDIQDLIERASVTPSSEGNDAK